jgi:hypothetical protein
MFNQVLENFRQATEGTVQMQQEMFKKWINLWPGIPASLPSGGEQTQQFQRKWAETLGDLFKRQEEMIEAQFKAGIENIEKAFEVAGVKTPAELCAKSLELWQGCFANLRQVYEAQQRWFEMAMKKWPGLTTKGPQ